MKKLLTSLLLIVGLTFNSYAADQNLENLRDEIKSLEITIEVYSSKLIKAKGDLVKKKKALKSYQDNAPTVISIDKDGNYYISPMDDSIPKSISLDSLITTALERIKARPEMKVFIRADKSVDYGTVIEIVAILKQTSSLISIGFMTSSEDSSLAIKNDQEALKEKARKVLAEIKRKAEEAKVIASLTKEEKDNLSSLRSAYINNIAARVRTFWRYQGADDSWNCDVYVQQDKNGNVESVYVQQCDTGSSSSNASMSDEKARAFRNSIERAVYKSSPLPAAPDNSVFIREIVFKFSVN